MGDCKRQSQVNSCTRKNTIKKQLYPGPTWVHTAPDVLCLFQTQENKSCSNVIHHTDTPSWILLTTTENKQEAPNQLPTPQHCQEQTLLADNPTSLKMLSEDSFGFSEHVMRVCVLVGDNVHYKEFTYKKSLSWLSAWGKTIFHQDDEQNIKSSKMMYQSKSQEVNTGNYSQKFINPSNQSISLRQMHTNV